MKKLAVILQLIIFVGLAWLGWDFAQGNNAPAPESKQPQPTVRNIVDDVAANITKTATELVKDIAAPPPLRAKVESPDSNLTRNGVLNWTNAARRNNGGLKPLTLNEQLNIAAEAKLRDMFSRQYFAHVSPVGVGPGDLADQASYDYLAVGENLALGNFADDQALVKAWMDSPGHRANILGKYDEIGIAVGRGTYEGQTTWLSVQEFGRPSSVCDSPDPALKEKVAADKARLADLTNRANAERAKLDATPKPRTNQEVDAYNAQVAVYNDLVAQIRTLGQQIQGEVTVFNGQVQAYNACVGK